MRKLRIQTEIFHQELVNSVKMVELDGSVVSSAGLAEATYCLNKK
jgi:hypothetical protein